MSVHSLSRVWSLAMVSGVAVAVAGCGGNEPFSVVPSPTSTVELTLPIQNSYFQYLYPFGQGGSDGWDFTYQAYGNTQPSIVAPASGLVTNVDTNLNAGYFAVTIYHGARVSSRVSKMNSASVRVGDLVTAGAQIGVITANPTLGTQGIRLSLFVDGIAVCPLSYLSSVARTDLNTRFNSAFPCQ